AMVECETEVIRLCVARYSAARQLSRKAERFVGEVARKDEVALTQRLPRLLDEALRRVVLRARIRIQHTVVDAREIVARALDDAADRALHIAFRPGRRRLKNRRRRRPRWFLGHSWRLRRRRGFGARVRRLGTTG